MIHWLETKNIYARSFEIESDNGNKRSENEMMRRASQRKE